LRWIGPQRVVSTLSDQVFEVEDLLNGSVRTVHATRLRFYHDSSLDITADILAHVAHHNHGYDVRAITDLRYNPEAKEFLMLVSWLGFEVDDATWEPLHMLAEDVPDCVHEFLSSFHDQELAARAKAAISF
jgi:Chromo (CHRromatin Organisation MOdifier) domain